MPNSLPPRCRELCPLNYFEGIEAYPISISRNCKGPKPAENNIGSRVHVDREGNAIREEIIDEPSAGGMVCRNAGVNLSLDALIKISQNEEIMEL